MEECEDNLSAEEIQNGESSPAVRIKLKKRSLVERELETNLTARVTSPVTGEGASTSRYGRARRSTHASETDAEKVMKPLKIDTKPQPQAYKMHASNSPIRKDSPNRAISVASTIEDQIENIYNENMALSRFGSEELSKGQSPAKKFPKIYIKKDLTQKPEPDDIVLIKNLFSPAKSNTHLNNIVERSTEKYSFNGHAAPRNGFPDTSSVVKALDFDGKKKKKEVKEKVVSKNELFELEAGCEYKVGDLAWARVGTYPFWPCIVTREPFTDMFVKKKLFGRVEHDIIHVTFFGDNGRRGWIVDNMLRKYNGRAEFETAREKFTIEAKKKDPRFYAAHFVSEKKLPQWNVSVEEAETFLREPKRLRIDILHDMLEKARSSKTTPKREKGGKITRTDSDVSLSESLYDTLFSEDDNKNDDKNSKKLMKKSLDVSEVVTACLDNMAAKSGITKIQKQSHMDRWLQKAKSKTPEKSQPKLRIKNDVQRKKHRIRKTKESRKSKLRKNESLSSEKNLLPYQNEHDYSSVNYENHDGSNINTDLDESGYNDTLNRSGIGIEAKVESLSSMEDFSQEDIITTVVNDDIVITDANNISKEIKVVDANDNDKIITKEEETKLASVEDNNSSTEESLTKYQPFKVEVTQTDNIQTRHSKRKPQSVADINITIIVEEIQATPVESSTETEKKLTKDDILKGEVPRTDGNKSDKIPKRHSKRKQQSVDANDDKIITNNVDETKVTSIENSISSTVIEEKQTKDEPLKVKVPKTDGIKSRHSKRKSQSVDANDDKLIRNIVEETKVTSDENSISPTVNKEKQAKDDALRVNVLKTEGIKTMHSKRKSQSVDANDDKLITNIVEETKVTSDENSIIPTFIEEKQTKHDPLKVNVPKTDGIKTRHSKRKSQSVDANDDKLITNNVEETIKVTTVIEEKQNKDDSLKLKVPKSDDIKTRHSKRKSQSVDANDDKLITNDVEETIKVTTVIEEKQTKDDSLKLKVPKSDDIKTRHSKRKSQSVDANDDKLITNDVEEIIKVTTVIEEKQTKDESLKLKVLKSDDIKTRHSKRKSQSVDVKDYANDGDKIIRKDVDETKDTSDKQNISSTETEQKINKYEQTLKDEISKHDGILVRRSKRKTHSVDANDDTIITKNAEETKLTSVGNNISTFSFVEKLTKNEPLKVEVSKTDVIQTRHSGRKSRSIDVNDYANDYDKINTKDIEEVPKETSVENKVSLSEIEQKEREYKKREGRKSKDENTYKEPLLVEVLETDVIQARRSQRKRRSPEDKNSSIVENKAKNVKLDLDESKVGMETGSEDFENKGMADLPDLQSVIAEMNETRLRERTNWYKSKLLPINGPKPVVIIEPLKMIGMTHTTQYLTQPTDVENDGSLIKNNDKVEIDELAVIEKTPVQNLEIEVSKETILVSEKKVDHNESNTIIEVDSTVKNDKHTDNDIHEDIVDQNGVDCNGMSHSSPQENSTGNEIDLDNHDILNTRKHENTEESSDFTNTKLQAENGDAVDNQRNEVDGSPTLVLENKEDLVEKDTKETSVVIGDEMYLFDRTLSQDYDEIYVDNINENYTPAVLPEKTVEEDCSCSKNDTKNLNQEVSQDYDEVIENTNHYNDSETVEKEKVDLNEVPKVRNETVTDTILEDTSSNDATENEVFDKVNGPTETDKETEGSLEKEENYKLKNDKVLTTARLNDQENKPCDLENENVDRQDKVEEKDKNLDEPVQKRKEKKLKSPRLSLNRVKRTSTRPDLKLQPKNNSEKNTTESDTIAVGDELNNDTNSKNHINISETEDSSVAVKTCSDNPTDDIFVENNTTQSDTIAVADELNNDTNSKNHINISETEDSSVAVKTCSDNPTDDIFVENNTTQSDTIAVGDELNNDTNSKTHINISETEDSSVAVKTCSDNPTDDVFVDTQVKEDTKINGFVESKLKNEIDMETASVKSEDSGVSINRRKIRSKDKQTLKKAMDDPEFMKYLEFRQDALIDEQPELTQDEIVTYLYQTWLYEESNKSDMKKTDETEQSNIVKGSNTDPVPQPKKIKKKSKVEKEPKVDKEKEPNVDIKDINLKDKPKRKITQTKPYYNEDFSDLEEEDLETFSIFDTDVAAKNENGEPVDEVELYFEKLPKPKPNVFKGYVRERVCEICERTENLVKCKGCHGMFHVECVQKEVQVVEVPAPTRGRKKKKKTRGRKPKGYEDSIADSGSQSDEKSQDANNSEELNISLEDELESHITFDADFFERQWEVKMKEVLPETVEGDFVSDQEIIWDAPPGQCEIVELKHKEKQIDLSEFKCRDCQKHETPVCFVCKSDTSTKGVIVRQKCQFAHCHRYYHLECLEYWPQTQFNSWEPSKTNKKVIECIEALYCPRHVCHTCVSDDPRGCKTRFCGDKLARCVRCPATYHSFTKCLPAGSQILTASQIICPRHYQHRPGKVPCHVNTGWCFICALGGTLICCEYCPTSFHAECLNIKPPEGSYMCEDCETGRLPLYGEMVWVKLGHYRWWPGITLHPTEIPDSIMAVKHSPGEFVVRFFGQYDHYWVNRGRVFPFQEGDSGKISSQKSKIDAAFTTAMEHAQRACEILKNMEPNEEEDLDIASSLLPPHYVKLKVNKPVGSLVARRDVDSNSLTQCECDVSLPEPCGIYSHCLNRMLLTECGPLCRAGDRCNNRAFEKRLYPRLAAARTSARGWGLKTLEDIKQGQFVIEYVGELIDEEEFRRRMCRKHEIRDENYYFLTLDKERMIDAGPKGNLARFMNHCCEPNCETQKWTVLGDVRVGLFALRDIPANSELTFNYNLECTGIEKKRCLCGAKRCSGYIGAKPKQEEAQPKKIKAPGKRTYKKRKNVEDSPSTSKIKPPIKIKIKPIKPRELTEIEKDLLIIKNATNGMSSDSEGSRLSSVDEKKDTKPLKRKRVSFSTEEVSSSVVKKTKLDDKVGD